MAFSDQPLWGGEPLVPREEDDETIKRLYWKWVGNCVNDKICSSSCKDKRSTWWSYHSEHDVKMMVARRVKNGGNHPELIQAAALAAVDACLEKRAAIETVVETYHDREMWRQWYEEEEAKKADQAEDEQADAGEDFAADDEDTEEYDENPSTRAKRPRTKQGPCGLGAKRNRPHPKPPATPPPHVQRERELQAQRELKRERMEEERQDRRAANSLALALRATFGTIPAASATAASTSSAAAAALIDSLEAVSVAGSAASSDRVTIHGEPPAVAEPEVHVKISKLQAVADCLWRVTTSASQSVQISEKATENYKREQTIIDQAADNIAQVPCC